MKNFIWIRFFVFVLLLLAPSIVSVVYGEVKVYPAPKGEAVIGVWAIKADGKPVDVYSAMSQDEGKEYYFASFDFSGKVKLEISAADFSFDKLVIGPDRFGVKTIQKKERSVILEADKPFQIVLEPNGLIKPLILFGNEIEKDIPAKDQKNVVYYGPGVHKTGKIVLKDNQTLYLAGGAVVKGCISTVGSNITIRGRGILAGEDSPRFNGPGRFMIDCWHGEKITVRDIILRNPWSWTFVTWCCQNVLIDNVKIMGSRMLNDDALDLVNTRNSVVKNCFFRSQDDNIAIKGKDGMHRRCENILIEDCVFWTDTANVFRIGYECETDGMRNIQAKNIDVWRYSPYNPVSMYWARAIVWLQPNQNMMMENCRFENFNIRSNGSDMTVVLAKPMSCRYGKFKKPVPGRIQNCSFKNFNIYGEKGNFRGELYMEGSLPDHFVNGMMFENFVYFGKKIDKNSPIIQTRGNIKDIEVR
ncbi:MAG: glycosyl hydrolase family 28 protein [Planctomycetia bacterium]|nr:glycosyl hydrolase family 28 protein [Planctomycetia bacterium]